MKVAILDDYHDTLRTLECFRRLEGHEVRVWTDHVQDTEALVLIRERTQIRAPLIERLPKLRFISQRSVWPHIDIEACARLGVVVSSTMHPGTPSYSRRLQLWQDRRSGGGLRPRLRHARAGVGARGRAPQGGRRRPRAGGARNTRSSSPTSSTRSSPTPPAGRSTS